MRVVENFAVSPRPLLEHLDDDLPRTHGPGRGEGLY